MKPILAAFALSLLLFKTAEAQPGRSYAREAVRKNVEKRMDSTYRKQGRKAVGDITYENDKRYKDPNNKVVATLAFVDSTFKKERVKSVTGTAMVFGKHGEAYVTRDELKPNEPDQQWFVYNYQEKANYIVMPKTKEAMKMPLINMQKMAERAAKKAAEDLEDGDGNSIEATDEYATFMGYKARKFVYRQSNGTVIDQWVSTTLKLNLGDNYVMGARLNAYRFPENPKYKDMSNGFVVRMVQYDKKGAIKYTRTISRFEKTADEKYFDLSGFKVNDVLGTL
jgi:hypothetical protein